MENLREAFVAELRDMLGGERQITKALRKMARKASAEELKQAFEQHLKQTEGQIERLGQALESIDEKPRGKHCSGIAGIVEEGEEVIEKVDRSEVLDAILIAGAQKVEHYEIATYGTLCAWAEQLGFNQAVELLEKNLVATSTSTSYRESDVITLHVPANEKTGVNQNGCKARKSVMSGGGGHLPTNSTGRKGLERGPACGVVDKCPLAPAKESISPAAWPAPDHGVPLSINAQARPLKWPSGPVRLWATASA